HPTRVDFALDAWRVGGKRDGERLATWNVLRLHYGPVPSWRSIDGPLDRPRALPRGVGRAVGVDDGQGHEAARVAKRHAEQSPGRAVVDLRRLSGRDAVSGRGLRGPGRRARQACSRALR